MAVAPSQQDLYDLGKTELILRRPSLFCEPGDITDFLIAAAMAMADKNVHYTSQVRASLFLDTSNGDDLTTLANDRYGIQRTAAVKSLVTASLTRAVANGIAGSIPIGSVVATTRDSLGGEVQFVALAATSYSASETGTKTVACEAVVAGQAGNVAAGAVTRTVSTLWDTITVTNVARAAGGAEEESDPALRERVRKFPSTIEKGTIAALEYGAKTVSGVAVATVVEGDGIVTVFVADSSGGSNTLMQDKVQTELELWRVAGVVVNVSGGAIFSQNVSFSLSVRTGTDVAALAATLQDAVTNRMAKLAIGETLHLDSLRAAIIAVNPERILSVTFTTPLADIVPASNELIRAGSVTVVA